MGGTDSRSWARTAPERFPYLLRTCGDNDREGRAGDVRVPTSCRRSGLAVRASFGRLGPGRTGGALIQWYRCTFTSVNSFLARSKESFLPCEKQGKQLPGQPACQGGPPAGRTAATALAAVGVPVQSPSPPRPPRPCAPTTASRREYDIAKGRRCRPPPPLCECVWGGGACGRGSRVPSYKSLSARWSLLPASLSSRRSRSGRACWSATFGPLPPTLDARAAVCGNAHKRFGSRVIGAAAPPPSTRCESPPRRPPEWQRARPSNKSPEARRHLREIVLRRPGRPFARPALPESAPTAPDRAGPHRASRGAAS